MKRPATRVADLLNPAATLLPAANVIMQLSLPGVGYGVLESRVDSGNVYKHPFKRARTTTTYLAVATIGTETDRLLIRAAVDRLQRERENSRLLDRVKGEIHQAIASAYPDLHVIRDATGNILLDDSEEQPAVALAG